MTKKTTKKLYHWLIIFNLGVLLLSGCGSDRRNAKDGLELSIQIPEGEQPDLFWYGVERKTLKLEPQGKDPVEMSWQPGVSLEMDLDEGDKIHFSATDSLGRILAEGEGTVPKEKKVSILVHRVL